MAHPLEDFRQVGDVSFIEKTEFEFYRCYEHDPYYSQIPLEVIEDRENKTLTLKGFDDRGDFTDYITIYTYFKDIYSKIEASAQKIIDNSTAEILDDKKQVAFIKPIIAALKEMQKKIAAFKLEGTNEKLREILLNKIESFSAVLSTTYLDAKVVTIEKQPKIKWKGNINVLTTLIYDLWKGQEKEKKVRTKPLLEAAKKDLEALLLNNFVDEEGNPLNASTMSDYLNGSKTETRAKIGGRIELEY